MRIILVEDSALIREGLKMVLTHLGHEIVAEAYDAPQLLEAVAAHETEVVITDVRMPPTHTSDGLEAALKLRAENPTLPILVLSQYITTAYARDLFSAGANGLGYLLKDRVGNIEEFTRALETVVAGGTVIDPDVVAQLMRAGSAPGGALENLSPRELEILSLMSQGKSNQEIEAELFVSSATVAKHIGKIFDKLNLPPEEGNRRVRAVLTFLKNRQ